MSAEKRSWRDQELREIASANHGVMGAAQLAALGILVDVGIVERALESSVRHGLCTLPRIEWRLQDLARQGRMGPGASVTRDGLRVAAEVAAALVSSAA